MRLLCVLFVAHRLLYYEPNAEGCREDTATRRESIAIKAAAERKAVEQNIKG